jgi:hypothetical protein
MIRQCRPKIAADTGAPEDEIEVTPEMIEAGIEAYRPYWADLADSLEGIPALMVREIYLAMAATKRGSSSSTRRIIW